MSPAFFPPSQTTAWAIFSQDTRAAVLVLWPHPGPMWPGLTVGMGEGLAWQSWALVGGRDSSSRPIPPSPCVKLHSGSQNTSRRGTETWGRRWCRRRKDGGGGTVEIAEGLELCCYCRLCLNVCCLSRFIDNSLSVHFMYNFMLNHEIP